MLRTKGEGFNFLRFCADVLYGRSLKGPFGIESSSYLKRSRNFFYNLVEGSISNAEIRLK